MRRNDDFIVDDEGYGYRDHGGEIWEQDEEDEEHGGKKKTNKKRKLDVRMTEGDIFVAQRTAHY